MDVCVWTQMCVNAHRVWMVKTHSLIISDSFYKSHGFSLENLADFRIIDKVCFDAK
jgi:hypothetical protein